MLLHGQVSAFICLKKIISKATDCRTVGEQWHAVPWNIGSTTGLQCCRGVEQMNIDLWCASKYCNNLLWGLIDTDREGTVCVCNFFGRQCSELNRITKTGSFPRCSRNWPNTRAWRLKVNAAKQVSKGLHTAHAQEIKDTQAKKCSDAECLD